jgi:uncharacterized protein YraI
MMRRAWIAAAAFCAALVLPALAAAQTLAYASYDGYTNVRAGPSTRYQIIAQLAPGTAVDVLGCLETRAWCQILIDDLEGWVYSRRLEFDYSGQRYLVPDYYSYFNAPFVYFNFGNYDNYDHRRRYRRDRSRYYDKPIVGHPGGGGPGPETIGPPLEETFGDPGGNSIVGHPGGGGPGPDQIPPMGTQQICPPDNPNCM